MNKEYNQILNLISFNINLSKIIMGNDPLNQSPDYIIEKYNHWIGLEPTVPHKLYTPDNMIDFFNRYWKIWRPNTVNIDKKFKNILMYLYSTQNMNLLTMVSKFEEYIGPFNMISDIPKRGLHQTTYALFDEILEINSDNIKIILRDLKIRNITN